MKAWQKRQKRWMPTRRHEENKWRRLENSESKEEKVKEKWLWCHLCLPHFTSHAEDEQVPGQKSHDKTDSRFTQLVPLISANVVARFGALLKGSSIMALQERKNVSHVYSAVFNLLIALQDWVLLWRNRLIYWTAGYWPHHFSNNCKATHSQWALSWCTSIQDQGNRMSVCHQRCSERRPARDYRDNML